MLGRTRAWVFQLPLDIFPRSLTTCFELSWSWRDRVLEWESLSVGIDWDVHLWDGVHCTLVCVLSRILAVKVYLGLLEYPPRELHEWNGKIFSKLLPSKLVPFDI